MNIGKLPNEYLKAHIISHFTNKRQDVITGPQVGRDCGVIDYGDYLCVISTDPITAADSRLGYLGVHVSCNDIVTTGADIVGITATILAPPNTEPCEIEQLVKELSATANQLSIDVLGGHTEVTDSVSRMILSITAIGKVTKDDYIQPSNAGEGDYIVLTKKAGIEGTAILAYDKQEDLRQHFSDDFILSAQSFMNYISVVPEGRIAKELGAHSMHDVTEGGVLGAAWELGETMDKGLEIYIDQIPIADETIKICNLYGIDPLRLISSGCMLIVTQNPDILIDKLSKSAINGAIIGRVTGDKHRNVIIGNNIFPLMPPQADELYKAFE